MRNSLRWLSLFMAPALVISLSALMVACSSDDGGDGGGVTANFLGAEPADGSSVPEGATVTLKFDAAPGTVTVNGGATTAAGNNATYTIQPGDSTLSIAWDGGDGGSASVSYTVLPPDTVAATLDDVSPNVEDATDVDPADLADGIELTFSEAVDVDELTISTGGSALAWINTTDGAVVTMQDGGDDPIVNETTYDVEGAVVDLGGNETNVSFSFTTKAKE